MSLTRKDSSTSSKKTSQTSFPSFLTSFDNSRLSQLIDYVLIDAPSTDDRKSAFKFPSVSAELLSTANPRVLDFFGIDREQPNSALNRLLDFFGEESPSENLTRASYVQKIINSLVSSRPSTFLPSVLGNDKHMKGLLANCHSKSVQSLVHMLLMGLSPNQHFGNASVMVSEKDNESLRNATLDRRLEIFSNLLEQCLEPVEKKGIDRHSSLCTLASMLFNKEYPDRTKFCQRFKEKFYYAFLENLVETFWSQTNKACFVLFSYFELAEKETDPLLFCSDSELIFVLISTRLLTGGVSVTTPLLNAFQQTKALTSAEKLKAFLRVDQSLTNPKKNSQAGFASTFLTEISRTNAKTIKIIEVLRIFYKKHLGKTDGAKDILITPELGGFLCQLFLQHPNNNVLHNQLLKLYSIILESKDEDAFVAFLFNNKEFFNLLQFINRMKEKCLSNGKYTARVGFLGHLKQLIKLLNEAKLEKLRTNEEFSTFMNYFYTIESGFENHCLGDVDIKPIDHELETNFVFNIEEIKTKYLGFLGYLDASQENHKAVQGTESGEVTSKEAIEVDSHPRPIETMSEADEVNAGMKGLDLSNGDEKSAYLEKVYWKPKIEFDPDTLESEIKQKK